MRKFLVEIQFNGKNYSGFQSTSNGNSIEDKIKLALKKLFDTDVEICGCSRTDAGVSAESYFFDFLAETKIPTERIPFKLNRFLPKDIQALSAREIPSGFNARFSAVSKTYEYGFYLSDHVMPLLNPRNFKLKKTINLEAMKNACQLFVGKHDFNAFKTPCKDKISTVRTIFSCDLINDGNRIILQICGDGFLYNMVRIIAGTIVEVGEEKLSLEQVSILLTGDKNRIDNPSITLPPNALLLKSVKYNL